jgi:hypothetical protein
MDEREAGAKGEGEVNQDDAEKILDQLAELRMTIDALAGKVSSALRDAHSALLELYGVAGNPGLSQQAAELRATLKAIEREVDAAGKHATEMLGLALSQQNQLGESLRAAIRGVEADLHVVRTAVDDRLRDFEAEVNIKVDVSQRDMIERYDSSERQLIGRLESYEKSTTSRFHDVNAFIVKAQDSTKLRERAILATCLSLIVASLVSVYFAVRGAG